MAWACSAGAGVPSQAGRREAESDLKVCSIYWSQARSCATATKSWNLWARVAGEPYTNRELYGWKAASGGKRLNSRSSEDHPCWMTSIFAKISPMRGSSAERCSGIPRNKPQGRRTVTSKSVALLSRMILISASVRASVNADARVFSARHA